MKRREQMIYLTRATKMCGTIKIDTHSDSGETLIDLPLIIVARKSTSISAKDIFAINNNCGCCLAQYFKEIFEWNMAIWL